MDQPQHYLPLSPHQFHILLALTDGERHGYGLIHEIERRTGGTLRLGTGTLYTAIARLVELELIADTGKADDRRRFHIPLIRRKHGFKRIRGGKNNLRQSGAFCFADLWRKNIFELVRDFTELMETARGGISLERVNRTADTANDFFVRRTGFELQAGFIERLQQFVRTLKEESAKLGAAILGLLLHPFTSMR